MRLLVLASAGGDAHHRALWATVAAAAREHDVRVLAPDAEGKLLRPLGVPVESWKPAGLFSVLRSVSALHRAVEHHAPAAVHAVGWTAAAVALGGLTPAQSARTIVSLVDPIHEGEIPRQFVEKRLGELLRRAARTTVAYSALGRVLSDEFGVERERVELLPPGAAPQLPLPTARPSERAGPLLGHLSPLDHDTGWQTAVGALAAVARALPDARLVLRADPAGRLAARSFARGLGVEHELTLLDEAAPAAEFLSSVDLVLVPSGRDGVPYALAQALVDGIPVVAANVAGAADTLMPFETGWLVPDDATGLAAGVEAAWAQIDVAWAGAQAQRPIATAAFDPAALAARTLALYAQTAELQCDERHGSSQRNASEPG